MIQNIIFARLLSRAIVTGMVTGLKSRHIVFGIIFSPYEYLTHWSSQNDKDDMVYEIVALLTSGRSHQYYFNIRAIIYNITNTGKTEELIHKISTT